MWRKGVWVAAVVVLAVAGCSTDVDWSGLGSSSSSSPAPSATRSGPAHERVLTPGEVELARTVFGDGVDYSVVLVHNHAYPLFGDYQPDDMAVTPNGEMYFPAPSHLDDFSADTPANARWFVHEMVHVWQFQLGYPVAARGMDRSSLRYDYQLDDGARLADYDMEQQGEIVADYVGLTTLGIATSRDGRYTVDDLEAYRTVLADFLADPCDTVSLPGW
ncbi:MAG: hypothetical protein FWD11_03715 [Micrococcales bacterium]|nr:hypothetical protein [Micrococcales bacterium]